MTSDSSIFCCSIVIMPCRSSWKNKPIRNYDFRYSTSSIVAVCMLIRWSVTIYLASKKTRSGLDDIVDIEKISMVVFNRKDSRVRCSGINYQSRAVLSFWINRDSLRYRSNSSISPPASARLLYIHLRNELSVQIAGADDRGIVVLGLYIDSQKNRICSFIWGCQSGSQLSSK